MYTTCGIYNQVQCKQYNKYINFLKYKSGVVYIIIIYTYSSLKRIPSFPYHSHSKTGNKFISDSGL